MSISIICDRILNSYSIGFEKKLCEIWLTNQTQTEEAGLNLWHPFALNGLSFKNLFQRTFRPLSSLSMNVKNDWQNLAQTDWNYETFLLMKSFKNLFKDLSTIELSEYECERGEGSLTMHYSHHLEQPE